MAGVAGRRSRVVTLVAMAIVAASFASTVTARELGFGMTATARVMAVRYYAELQHNVADLAGTFTNGASYEADFLTNFDRTGGVERWGFPTSAIFEETRGTLTQYYQRGVVDWQPSPGGGRHTFQRRLAWDHLGGGLDGSRDQGVEPGLRNPHPGEAVGPWGHKVSNLSIEGVATGFADFFHRLGGVASFGYPKTDARRDTHPQAVLHDPGRPVDSRIRQYFQAAVLEFHPESAVAPVKLRLLGDTLRNRKYPNETWRQFPAFTSKPAFSVGDEARLNLLEAHGTGAPNGSVTDTVQHLRPSLLRVETDKACGSGFFVTDNGWAVTAWHVVEGARSVTVTTSSGHRGRGVRGRRRQGPRSGAARRRRHRASGAHRLGQFRRRAVGIATGGDGLRRHPHRSALRRQPHGYHGAAVEPHRPARRAIPANRRGAQSGRERRSRRHAGRARGGNHRWITERLAEHEFSDPERAREARDQVVARRAGPRRRAVGSTGAARRAVREGA